MDRSHTRSILVLFVAVMVGILASRFIRSLWPDPVVMFVATAGVIMAVDLLLTALLERTGWGGGRE
ncbi:hypothetical protein E2N92_06015 [Methanofollis formosanus]|uniref:Uncharacterized protein n=1 Tax=Methanofollis formosanus TaxID=299308 RepID=A0A8G1A0N7_9EURY|nr:hypothetical protein [Methanofollis formosanus]QYZ79012.1 hypothetical protein E2N92_06015 [Methanofollis formosanus]